MFSIVMPTYNRASMLKRTLNHLFTLAGISDCEVIVVNDASNDETPFVLKDFGERYPANFRYMDVTKGGPGHARNHGVQAAQNERILFMDDDVFPQAGLIQSHWRMLENGYTGSQGILFWHPEIELTPLIRHIDSLGTQFAFDEVKDPTNLDFSFVYTANFAVSKRAVLDAGGFDTNFFIKKHGFSGYEDTILAYKLVHNGSSLALNKEAVSHHLHHMSEEGILSREYKVGYAAGMLQVSYPEIAKALGLASKDVLVGTQVELMNLANRTGIPERFFGYPVAIRLRHREAFYRGLLHFKTRGRAEAEQRAAAQ